jgi:hypothetical protein
VENIHPSLHKFDKENKSIIIETDFQSDRGSSAIMERHISVVVERFEGKLERILSELKKMTQLVKQPSK